MRWLLAMLMVLVLAGGAMAGDCVRKPDCCVPVVTTTRLITQGGNPTALVIYVVTPFDQGFYRLRSKIFNKNLKKVTENDSEWFYSTGESFVYESIITPTLKGSDYFVKTKLLYAPKVHNEK